MPCSILPLARQPSGICQAQRCSAALLDQPFPDGWALVATADFNGDNKPDYVLYKGSTGQTATWYLNNNIFVAEHTVRLFRPPGA